MVADYLNQYKTMAADSETCSNIFFDYLLSECWHKMYWCISTIPVLAFIYGLVTHWSMFHVQIAQFKWDDPEFAQPGPGDSMLTACIQNNSKELDLLEAAFGEEAPEEY